MHPPKTVADISFHTTEIYTDVVMGKKADAVALSLWIYHHIPLRGADSFGTEGAVGGEIIKVLAREVAGDVEKLGEGAGGDGGVGGGRRACLHLFFVLAGRHSLL